MEHAEARVADVLPLWFPLHSKAPPLLAFPISVPNTTIYIVRPAWKPQSLCWCFFYPYLLPLWILVFSICTWPWSLRSTLTLKPCLREWALTRTGVEYLPRVTPPVNGGPQAGPKSDLLMPIFAFFPSMPLKGGAQRGQEGQWVFCNFLQHCESLVFQIYFKIILFKVSFSGNLAYPHTPLVEPPWVSFVAPGWFSMSSSSSPLSRGYLYSCYKALGNNSAAPRSRLLLCTMETGSTFLKRFFEDETSLYRALRTVPDM